MYSNILKLIHSSPPLPHPLNPANVIEYGGHNKRADPGLYQGSLRATLPPYGPPGPQAGGRGGWHHTT